MSDALPTESAKTRQMVVNGTTVPFADATVHLMSPAMRYGLNVFEGLRGYWNDDERQLYIFRLQEHLERFDQSIRLLRFKAEFRMDAIADATLGLLRADNHRANCHIRTTAYLDGIGEHHVTGPVSWMVYAGPRPRGKKVESGIAAHVSTWRRMSDNALPPRIKCGANYANARLARFQAQIDGYDDAIMLNDEGKVGEGPGACIFIVRKNKLITPSVTSGILESITRDTILTLAQDRGISIEERAVDRTELYASDEAFFAGSAAEVLPIISIDRLPVGSGAVGPVTSLLQKDYFDAVEGRGNLEKSWLTPVWNT
ncbi:branched-chain amino acid transaminase [Phyllobacterium sp. YR531]|uniref:branched-chain amino acid transaminase n=1 Tax=Phyllobacterium sp. YR531 TaxID=1144343 RepID=UPI00026FB1D7|nr:branched-chain amino acid transaminase [Phyllobacterium sp. YR531]EJN06740.1 branched-chain amino acid aminotransferase, group I [Phyllobacterium sp. YR531]